MLFFYRIKSSFGCGSKKSKDGVDPRLEKNIIIVNSIGQYLRVTSAYILKY
jgi:hypothetical protein